MHELLKCTYCAGKGEHADEVTGDTIVLCMLCGGSGECLPTHYVLYNGSAWLVKEAGFFKWQGGLDQSWGEAWKPIVARDLSHAREIAEASTP